MDDKEDTLSKIKSILEGKEKADMSSVKIGDIIYVSLDKEDGLILNSGFTDRKKYIVIVGFTPEGIAIGALLINSKITEFKYQNKDFLECQYPLLCNNYPNILEYNSWLDCSDIFEIPKVKITSKCGLVKGCLNEEDTTNVMTVLRNTDVIDNATKRRFGII